MPSGIYIERLNTTIGTITILSKIEDNHKIIRYNCECSCGNKLILTKRQLRPDRKYCPKCRCNISCRNGYKDIGGKYWNRCIREAKNRNLEFNITIKYAWNLFLKQDKLCSLSGVPIELDLKCGQIKCHKQTASLDRIDSKKGYIKGNVQWVHKEINWVKCDMHDDKFIDWCQKVTKHQKFLKRKFK